MANRQPDRDTHRSPTGSDERVTAGRDDPVRTGTDSDSESYIQAADRELDAAYEEPLGIEEYVELLLSEPHLGAHAPKYLLDAIEYAGTRTVIEEGEEKERYCFFDDPWNDGEHAILGNTEVLNRFVDDLRSIAAGRG